MAEGAALSLEKTLLSQAKGGVSVCSLSNPHCPPPGVLSPAEILPGMARAKAHGQAGSLDVWVDLSTPKHMEITLR